MKRILSFLLTIVCVTSFAQTHWIPNSAPYEDYMSVIAVVSVNGDEQASTSLEVGAFCGSECRGSAIASYFPPTQRYIYQLPVYGNNGDAITFRLYDHDTQTELNYTSQTNLTYIDNGYGSLGNPCALNFVSSTVAITASVTPAGAGTVTGAGDYLPGSTATLVATANQGYTFVSWLEGSTVVSSNASYSFTVTGSRNLVATFSQQNYTVTVSANPSAGGTVAVSGNGQFTYGQQCTVTATPASGYTFVNWKEGSQVVSTNASYSFTVSGNRNLVATFSQQNYTVTVSANPSAGGTVAVSGNGQFTYGQQCTVTATPASGYTFVNWKEGTAIVSTNASYSFTVSGNRNLVANFEISGSITPHWVPNSDPYEDYMSVIAVVQIDQVEQSSTTLEVGAFCGEECRGSAFASYFPPTQRYIYQLPVYGNNGDAITFRLFDHDTQTELNLNSETDLTYTDNGYGSLGNPCNLIFTTETPSGFPIPLNTGWNWISYLPLTEMPVTEAFASIQPHDGDVIKSQNSFCTYNATNHQWYGSLFTMQPGQGYMYLNNGGPMTLYYPEVGE